jgi:hypothetical protein
MRLQVWLAQSLHRAHTLQDLHGQARHRSRQVQVRQQRTETIMKKQVIVFHPNGTNTPVSEGIIAIDADSDPNVVRLLGTKKTHLFNRAEVSEILVREWHS